MRAPIIAVLVGSIMGCTEGMLPGSTADAGATGGQSSGGTAQSSSAAVSSSTSLSASTSAGASSATAGSGPQVYIHVRATAAPFVHTDAWAGQTPREHFNGIRSYSILRDGNDTAPVRVFDHGTGFVEAGYNDGDDTIVGQVTAASLPRAVYTVGRVVVSHVRYKVDATLHGTYTLQGEFQNLLVLGDDVTLDGSTYDRGHYRYVFHSGVQDYPLEGFTTTLPLLAPGAGIRVTTQGNETVLYFDMNLPVDPDVPQDVHVYMTFNVHEAFRWEDLPTAGYATGVFDASSTSYEPIRQFGANDYTITFD